MSKKNEWMKKFLSKINKEVSESPTTELGKRTRKLTGPTSPITKLGERIGKSIEKGVKKSTGDLTSAGKTIGFLLDPHGALGNAKKGYRYLKKAKK